MIATDALALWATRPRTVTRTMLLSAEDERELVAAGWVLVAHAPQRWRDPATGCERTPTAALRCARRDAGAA